MCVLYRGKICFAISPSSPLSSLLPPSITNAEKKSLYKEKSWLAAIGVTTEPDDSYRETHLEQPASEAGACIDSWERVRRYPVRRQELAKAVLAIQTEFTRFEHKGWVELH